MMTGDVTERAERVLHDARCHWGVDGRGPSAGARALAIALTERPHNYDALCRLVGGSETLDRMMADRVKPDDSCANGLWVLTNFTAQPEMWDQFDDAADADWSAPSAFGDLVTDRASVPDELTLAGPLGVTPPGPLFALAIKGNQAVIAGMGIAIQLDAARLAALHDITGHALAALPLAGGRVA